MDRRQLEKAVGGSPVELQGELRRLASLGKIRNIGTPSYPEWCWQLGNQATSKELRRAVIWLLRREPMTIHDLAYTTGAHPARVVLEVQAIQRGPHGKRLRNLGRRGVPKWLLLSPDADLSELEDVGIAGLRVITGHRAHAEHGADPPSSGADSNGLRRHLRLVDPGE